MAHTVTQGLNGQFGAMIAGVSLADLKSPEFQDQSLSLWHAHGLFAVRGHELADIAPAELVDWSAAPKPGPVLSIPGPEALMTAFCASV